MERNVRTAGRTLSIVIKVNYSLRVFNCTRENLYSGLISSLT
jgi:hypothetical protein